ncbi:MAG: DUF1844 domain-containing protein [candidate division Zixibacteria bacterium]|nr:DUF1844 domain-containing protein [candidate division Zixibacteria bacterium]
MPDDNPYFISLVASLQSTGMMQLGKIINPASGAVDRDLEGARQIIELLAVLEEKTKGNLTDEERRFLERALFELRMNFLDETTSKAPPSPTGESTGHADSD